MQQVGRRQGEIERVRMDADAAPANQIGRHRLVPARVDKVCIGKPERRGIRKGLVDVSIPEPDLRTCISRPGFDFANPVSESRKSGPIE